MKDIIINNKLKKVLVDFDVRVESHKSIFAPH